MAVQSARVLADGWTLEVRGVWPASVRDDFQLFDTPDQALHAWDETTARVRLTVTSQGYERQGAMAVGPLPRRRVVVAHDVRPEPFRIWPQQPAGPVTGANKGWPLPRSTERPLGEVDHGDGTRTIRLMLHKPVAPGDAFTLEFRPGWRAGLGAQSLSETACVNDSATPIEPPAARWITMPYEAVRDTTRKRIDLLAAHGLPEGRLGVAGVRLCATDGATKLFAWAEPGWSEAYGDRVRCWTVEMDWTGLNPGPVAVHWSVFPWVGPARHSSGGDPAELPASTLHPGEAAIDVGLDLRAENPLVFGYDPAGTLYGYTTTASHPEWPATAFKYVAIPVDPAGLVATNPASAQQAELCLGLGQTPQAAEAAARGLPPSRRPANTVVAMHVIRQLGRSLPAANGRGPRSNVGDGIEILLADGLHIAGTAAAPSGMGIGEVYTVWRGSSPAACELRTPASGTGSAHYAGRRRLMDLSVILNATALLPGATQYGQLVRCRVGRVAGSTYTNLSSHQAPANRARLSFAACDLEPGPRYDNLNGNSLLMRSCRLRSSAAAVVAVNNETAPVPSNQVSLQTSIASASDPACWADHFRWGNRIMGRDGAGAAAMSTPAVEVNGRQRTERLVIVNNLIEYMSGTGTFAIRMGELQTVPQDVIGLVFEGNTIVGNRINWMYGNMVPGTIAQAQDPAFSMVYRQCRAANNVLDRWPIKGDCFASQEADTLRAAAFPGETAPARAYLGQAWQQWQAHFGFMMEANASAHRETGISTLFPHMPENRGLRHHTPPTSEATANTNWHAFVDDRCRYTTGQGFGDYRPTGATPWRRIARSAQIDAGIDGVLRGETFPAGALAGIVGESATVGGAQAWHGLRSGEPGLVASPPVANVGAARAVHALRSSAAGLSPAAPAGPGIGLVRRRRVGAEGRRRRAGAG